MQDNPKERRKHTRIPLQFEAKLQMSNNAVYTGKTKNISFSGVYLFCANAADATPGDTGTLRLILDSQPNQSAINFRCQVVRTDESGIGIKFIGVDIPGYQELKNLMVYNSPDPDKLLAELKRNPGLEIYKG